MTSKEDTAVLRLVNMTNDAQLSSAASVMHLASDILGQLVEELCDRRGGASDYEVMKWSGAIHWLAARLEKEVNDANRFLVSEGRNAQ